MTTLPTLGKLERVDMRATWRNEASDFTPWLAREENIALLGEAIGLDLEVQAQEKSVGPYSADILCKDTTNNTWVLIENQLEKTDHTHARVFIRREADITDRSKWPEQHQWLRDNLTKFKEVFQDRVRALPR